MSTTILPLTGATPAQTIGPRSHHITVVDRRGQTHRLVTRGSLLLLDPQLAVQAEAQGLDYVYLNPANLALLSVESDPESAREGPRELLGGQLNGHVAEGGEDLRPSREGL